MKTIYLSLLFLGIVQFAIAQMYFPPKTGNEWATVMPAELGWQTDRIPDLLDFLAEKNSKAFIVLKDGKIAIEQYFGDFRPNDLWYWASAGKTVAALLVGVAQDQRLLHLDDPTSRYLGEGWTNAPLEKEDLITIRHQLNMTAGLNDQLPPTAEVPDPANCLTPDCLQYLANAGTRWAYHNAPYRLLQDVVAAAARQSWQQYTNQQLKQKIGMRTGTWFNYVFWSQPRDMARFGLLMLNRGIWAGEAIIKDERYFQEMISPSQALNPSYGYLWWLNGQEAFMLPQLRTVFPRQMLPSAPSDLYMGLGRNDQKLYVYPSANIVVIRLGESAEGGLALSDFDDVLWEKLMRIFDVRTTAQRGNTRKDQRTIRIIPNPGRISIRIDAEGVPISYVEAFNSQGQLVATWTEPLNNEIDVSRLRSGLYVMMIRSERGLERVRWLKQWGSGNN